MSTSAPRILILDTYYPEFLKSIAPPNRKLLDYERELDWIMQQCFGTYDCYSRGLGALGWGTEDVIVNHHPLNYLHPYMHPRRDVCFYQDLNLAKTPLPVGPVIAGQISCAWPGDDVIKRFDILFTSFPHYVDRINALGVKAVYLPLAFDPIVYERWSGPPTRSIACSFVGGLERQFGDRREVINYLIKAIPGFRDFGYGGDTVPAWGLDMYRVYAASKIVFNMHHPASNGYSNNLRMFEATGMGAMLLTECSPNIEDFFELGGDDGVTPECIVYESLEHAIEMIEYYLDPAHEPERLEIAAAGHLRTLKDHTYTQRMPIVDRELRLLLESKKERSA